MTTFVSAKRAVRSTVLMAIAALVLAASLLSPALPTADASGFGKRTLNITVSVALQPCGLLKSNPSIGGPSFISRTRNELENLGYKLSQEEVIGVAALSVLSHCPQFHRIAATVDGVPYGPWVMIPVSSPELSVLSAYWRGQYACGVAANSGVDAGVQALARQEGGGPNYSGIGINEAKVAMLLSAASVCSGQMAAVRNYLGG